MRVYVAAPLFNQAELAFNNKLADQLETMGFEVFLPQRDGVERNKPPFDKVAPDARRRAMFDLDRDEVLRADIFLFILDGRVPDEGACVELGMAYAHKFFQKGKKHLIGLHTDQRAAFLGGKLNPMIKVPLDELFETEEQLKIYLKTRLEVGHIHKDFQKNTMQQKVCPVIIRRVDGKTQLLLFKHPISELGIQLVKGTIEPYEAPEVAALRELEEESGISKASIEFKMGEISFPEFDQYWHVYQISYQDELPEQWEYFADEDGGMLFEFFWQDLDQPIENNGYMLFEEARQFIVQHLS